MPPAYPTAPDAVSISQPKAHINIPGPPPGEPSLVSLYKARPQHAGQCRTPCTRQPLVAPPPQCRQDLATQKFPGLGRSSSRRSFVWPGAKTARLQLRKAALEGEACVALHRVVDRQRQGHAHQRHQHAPAGDAGLKGREQLREVRASACLRGTGAPGTQRRTRAALPAGIS